MRTRELCVVNGASPEGKEVWVTLHQSGNDLWPLEMIQTKVWLQTGMVVSLYTSKAGK